MADLDPVIITSRLSRDVKRKGFTLRVAIYRSEDDPGWILEVVNERGTSVVWDDLFDTDEAADAVFRQTLAEEGVKAFLDSAKIIPFKR